MVFVCLVRHLRCLHPFLIGRSFVLSLAVEVVAMIQGGAFFSEDFREWGWNLCRKSYILFVFGGACSGSNGVEMGRGVVGFLFIALV